MHNGSRLSRSVAFGKNGNIETNHVMIFIQDGVTDCALNWFASFWNEIKPNIATMWIIE